MVSVIIATYNHLEDCLKPCIESIKKYTTLDNIEVIVVANGCTDDTAKYVKSLGKPFRLIWSKKPLGYSKANNVGMDAARGNFLVLLNNDVVLLPQEKDTWLQMLQAPFAHGKVGITGPIKGHSSPADRDFVIFFCAMISRVCYEDVGRLDEVFGVGGGEDTDYCIRAQDLGYELVQVPEIPTKGNGELIVGGFPIYHKGEATVNEHPEWKEIFKRNSDILTNRYNNRWKLSNCCERAVIGKDHDVPPREHTRYDWASNNIVGRRVLEIGCSSGYALKYLKNVDYLGIDKDKNIIDYAIKQFGPHFKVADINTFDFGFYDTIIAFEVLEHIPNGKEMAQKLKKHCNCLLITCPYKEIKGLWGMHHKLHALDERDFPGFEIKYVLEDGRLADKPDKFNGMNLMLMKWSKSVSAVVCTRNRTHTTLPMCLSAIVNQTYKPTEIIVYDDSPDKPDLRKIPHYSSLFAMINRKGIGWKVLFGTGEGQVLSHRRALTDAVGSFIWRVDDDDVPEPEVLGKLMSCMDDDVGAVGGLVLDPQYTTASTVASNNIEDIYLGLNRQWYSSTGSDIYPVDHLYSTFLFRKSAAKPEYYAELSRIGHREETIFTYSIKRDGWKVLINPAAVTWHLKQPLGGIRDGKAEMWAQDEAVFSKKLAEWGVTAKRWKVIVLDNGLGDHYVFRKILPEIMARYPYLILGVCWTSLFDDVGLKLISIAEARNMTNVDSVYKFMAERNWKGTLEDAYREMYLN